MNNWGIDVPVIFIFFNREKTTRSVFEQIKKARPRVLFLVSDGPRKGKNEERIVETLRGIRDEIDWDCELYTDYAETNMGCDKRIVSGVTVAFEKVDRAIILEDDCFPSVQFFSFAKEMLEKYKDEERIAYIASNPFVKGYRTGYDYFFSRVANTWAWATWKSRWMQLNCEEEYFKKKVESCYKGVFSEEKRKEWLAGAYKYFSNNEYPWDYLFDIVMTDKLRVVPAENLAVNIGFSLDSTHTLLKPNGYHNKMGRISDKYIGPDKIETDRNYELYHEKKTKNHIWNKVIAKMKMFWYKSVCFCK